MKVLGMELAPLSVPMERRLQTFSVLHYTYIFLFMGFGMIALFIYLLFTDYYYIPLLYFIWYYFDRPVSRQGGRRVEWFRRWKLYKYFADYFPIKIVKTAELHPSKNYIMGLHPHGIMCHSHICNFGSEGTGFSEIFPAIKPYLCVLSGQFMFPVFREYFIMSGNVSSRPVWVLCMSVQMFVLNLKGNRTEEAAKSHLWFIAISIIICILESNCFTVKTL